MKPRLQNKVAGSAFTLPVCIAVAALLWWWLPRRELLVDDVLGFAVCLLTAYVCMETNARQHLIRIRTQMMACVWLVLSASLGFMHPVDKPIAAAALLALAYMLLFQSYQRYRPEGYVFHAFLMLGLGSLMAPVMLPMGLLFFVYLGTFLRSLTWRTFWAGVLGLAAPYICLAAWHFTTEEVTLDDLQLMRDNIQMAATLLPASFEQWLTATKGYYVTIFNEWPMSPYSSEEGWGEGLLGVLTALVVLLGITGCVHFLRTNYDDKIRARMLLYIYVVQTLLLVALLLLWPSGRETTLALLTVSASPLIAHYFSLSRSLVTTIVFVLSLLCMAAVAVLGAIPPGFLP